MNDLAFLLDMDGVLYRGETAIPEARAFLERIRDFPHLFLTNNSSATPAALVKKLLDLGYPPFDQTRVLTSAIATAEYLQSKTPNFRYFAVGGIGLHEALRHYGTEDVEQPDYVVVGEGGGLTYESLTLGINMLMRGGAQLIGTNPDLNLDGCLQGRSVILPGGGALIAPFATATGIEPLFIGKPAPWLYREALRRLNRSAPNTVMIGDRPDTDIKGAAELGLITVLVRTGRFPPDALYPDDLPKPSFDVRSLNELAIEDLLHSG